MTPYPHQQAAIAAVLAHLPTCDRRRVTMACGTGKTETAAWCAVGTGCRTVNARIVVGVPSLNLVDQTWRRWARMFDMPPAMAVCSDERVGREVFRVSDYGLPSTSTSAAEIARFLAVGGPCVVFCTYQSAERLAEAMDAPGIEPFDFAICDEAHHLTGKNPQGGAFLDAGRIKASQRMFLTATPRIVRGDDVISMDDASQFGPAVYTYSFGEAIRDGRLSQFQIVAVQVDDPRVSVALASDKGVEDAAVVVAVAKAMRDYNLRRVISFHSLVKRAQAFAEALPGVCASLPDAHRIEGVYANHIHAGTPMDVRRSELARLQSADGWTLLSNARCLGEGVDVPELDGIVFADPRTSQIEIWQAIGRAIRKSDAGKVATVLIPVFIPKGMDAEQAIEGGRFRPVFDVLKAMQAHDPIMSEVIVKWSERARGGGSGEAKDVEPLRFVFNGSASMASALSAVVVGRCVAESTEQRYARVRAEWPHVPDQDKQWVRAIRSKVRHGIIDADHASAVFALSLGIQMEVRRKSSKHIEITEDMFDGMSAREIAQSVGASQCRVRMFAERHGLGFRPSAAEQMKSTWTDVDPLLGKESDASIADRFGLKKQTVQARRSRKGIARFAPVAARLGSLAEPLQMTTVEVASVAKCSVRAARRHLKRLELLATSAAPTATTDRPDKDGAA